MQRRARDLIVKLTLTPWIGLILSIVAAGILEAEGHPTIEVGSLLMWVLTVAGMVMAWGFLTQVEPWHSRSWLRFVQAIFALFISFVGAAFFSATLFQPEARLSVFEPYGPAYASLLIFTVLAVLSHRGLTRLWPLRES